MPWIMEGGSVMERKPIRLTLLGNIVVVLGFIMVLGIIGWIEGL